MKRLRNLLLFFLITLTLALSGLSVVFGLQSSYDLMHPVRVPCCEMPEYTASPLEEVAFETSDGLTLHGWYIPPQNGAVILMLHGRGGNRSGVLSMIPPLTNHGYGVLALDLRGHGQSDGENFAYSWRDVTGAADFLHKQPGVEMIGGIGFSLGANVIVTGAAYSEHVTAVVGDGVGPAQWADLPTPATPLDWLALPGDIAAHFALQRYEPGILSIHEALRRISPRPVLLITGDHPSNEYELRVNQRLMADAPESVTLWVAPGAAHVGAQSSYPQDYEARVLAFFDTHLLR